VQKIYLFSIWSQEIFLNRKISKKHTAELCSAVVSYDKNLKAKLAECQQVGFKKRLCKFA